MARIEGVVETVSLEDTPLLTAFSKSHNTGWSVAIGIPRADLLNPLWRSLAIIAAFGLASLLIGLAFAVQMAQRVARAEADRELLMNELNHRVKNTLATVQAIVTRTLRGARSPADASNAVEARLIALSRAHNVLSEENWASAELREIVQQALTPHAAGDETRLQIFGPDIRLSPRAALSLSLVLNELATNAAKYGALADADGQVRVIWRIAEARESPRLILDWTESTKRPIAKPEHSGFGSLLIRRSIEQDLRGKVALEFDPHGVKCLLDIPLAALSAAHDQAGRAA
jgi:two-component sensor histidine kinase